MDTLAALALATEKPQPNILKGKPIKKTEKVVTVVMIRNVVSQFIYQFIMMICVMYFADLIQNYDYNFLTLPYVNGLPTPKTIHYTLMFESFMMMTIFNQVNCRRLGVRDFNIF